MNSNHKLTNLPWKLYASFDVPCDQDLTILNSSISSSPAFSWFSVFIGKQCFILNVINKKISLEQSYIDKFCFTSSDWSYKGSKLLVGQDEGLIKLFDCDNTDSCKVLAVHGGRITCIKFHPLVDYLFFSTSDDYSIRVWHLKGICMALFDGHVNIIHHLDFKGYTLVSTGSISTEQEDGIKKWDLNNFYDKLRSQDIKKPHRETNLQFEIRNSLRKEMKQAGVINDKVLFGIGNKEPSETSIIKKPFITIWNCKDNLEMHESFLDQTDSVFFYNSAISDYLLIGGTTGNVKLVDFRSCLESNKLIDINEIIKSPIPVDILSICYCKPFNWIMLLTKSPENQIEVRIYSQL